MKTNDYLKLCHYYKGEEKNPYTNLPEALFWEYEKQYFFNPERVPNGSKYWQEHISDTARDYADMAPYLLDKILPVETRGMLAFACEDLAQHNPIARLDLLRYFPENVNQTILERYRHKPLLNDCKYYKGEEECPYPGTDIKSTYWRLESIWVEEVNDNEILRDEYGFNFTIDFPDDMAHITSIPFYLKATMYDQYRHFGGSKEGFEDWLYSYLESD